MIDSAASDLINAVLFFVIPTAGGSSDSIAPDQAKPAGLLVVSLRNYGDRRDNPQIALHNSVFDGT
jgi:hypothetical protein